MLINYYSQFDFNTLTEREKWSAYLRLRQHANALQDKLDGKSDVIGEKRQKIDYLKTARQELLRQLAARNHAGSDVRTANYLRHRQNLIGVYLEMENEHKRLAAEAEANGWPRHPKRLPAKKVYAEYLRRFSSDGNAVTLGTARDYIKEFKRGLHSHPEVYLAIND